MMKRLLIYPLISIVSYMTGVSSYFGALRLFYGQGMGSDSDLIWMWVGAPFFFFVVPLYIAIILFLQAIRRRSFLLQTIAFLIPGYLAMGAAYFPFGLFLLMNPFSPEASLFLCCYGAAAVVFSLGSWLAEKTLSVRQSASN